MAWRINAGEKEQKYNAATTKFLPQCPIIKIKAGQMPRLKVFPGKMILLTGSYGSVDTAVHIPGFDPGNL